MTCTRPGCDKPIRAADLCEAHYRAASRTGHCTIDDCTAPIYARLRCARHYEQWRGANAVKPRCAVDGCDRPRRARDWCEMHYRRWRTTGTTADPTPTPADRLCTYDGCTNRLRAKGLCASHLAHLDRYGAPRPLQAPKRKGSGAAKSRVKRAKKPKSNLPPGWFKPSPKSSEKGNTLTQDRIDTLLPLLAIAEGEIERNAPAVRRLLARHDALDLAEMLGVA